MPERNVPFDRILLPTIEAYYAIGDVEKADSLSARLFSIMEENLNYYMSLEPRFASLLMDDMAISHAVMGRLMSTAGTAGQTPSPSPFAPVDSMPLDVPETLRNTALATSLRERFEEVERMYQEKLMELQGAERRNTTRMRF